MNLARSASSKTSLFCLVAALIVVVPFALAACGSDEEPVDTTALEQESEDSVVSEPTSSDSNMAESSSGYGTALEGDLDVPSDFPSRMPLPAGTSSVREDVASGGYSAFVPGRALADVVADMENALPASGWDIVERTADIGTVGDMLFLVEGQGAPMYVFVEPSGGSEEDMRVLYYSAE